MLRRHGIVIVELDVTLAAPHHDLATLQRNFPHDIAIVGEQ
jgi:hypothetical protein